MGIWSGCPEKGWKNESSSKVLLKIRQYKAGESVLQCGCTCDLDYKWKNSGSTGTYSSSILYGRTLCRFRDGDAQGNKDRQTGDPCGTGTAVSENFIRAVGDRFAFWKEHSIIKDRTKEKGV